jgi:hypothetical protein
VPIIFGEAMDHVEEKEFSLRLQVRRVFAESYDGDDDGYAWWDEFAPVAAEIVAAARRIAASRGFTVRPANRGRPADEEVTLVVERREP